ncbi:hypothetical protein HJFPF1_02285 [Paramyrothecium foliicola]|nr:hypothetical protein HJFPF1_02285 [Paramyrothecium foliicola]
MVLQVLRDVGLREDARVDEVSIAADIHGEWLEWVEQESRRRTKLVGFAFLHAQSNVWPVLRSSEVQLRRPCSTREWKAATAVEWQRARLEARKEQLNFQAAQRCFGIQIKLNH